MKRILVLVTLCFAVSCCWAQSSKSSQTSSSASTDAAEIKFENNVLDLGTVKLNQEVTDTYTFKNVGKKPLVLYNVVAACSCTKVEYSKAPIKPGQTGTIKVKFLATRPDEVGPRQKRVTVDSNAKNDRVILTLKANVVME